ncbi:hypothetical protein L596_020162 [Steinernema carpocapsae]|nr:hypothetical protein L596_020162 [Steinernema carpocapsae]
MLATAEEFEQFKEEVDEVRQQMVYSLQFAKKFQDVESLLKEDEKLMAAEEDIERWFQRCWWRRGDPQTCRQEMLNSGAVDMYHKVTKEPGKPLSRGPLPNPNKPAKKQEKIEPKADKKINALFSKACAKEKVEEPDKNKHVKKSPMKPVTQAEKEEILKTSPLFKKTARKAKIDDLEVEVEEMQIENKRPPKRGKRIDFDMSQDIFSTGDSPSPKKMDDEEDFNKPSTKKTKSKAKKAAAKRDIFEAKPNEETKEEPKASTSKAEEEDKGPKVVKSKEIGHDTYMDEDGFIVTKQKTVTVEREIMDDPIPQKTQVKRGTTPTTEGAPPAKKKAPKGQAKISSFFGAPKK